MLSWRFSLSPEIRASATLLTVSFVAVLASACGSSPTAPTPTKPDPPALSCPADQTIQATSGQSAVVSYPAPTVSKGTPPVTLSCTPASGSAFPVGNSTVTCTATDADQRANACSFTVTVQPVATPPPAPQVAFTRFVAFGDSLTQGVMPFGGIVSTPYPLDLQSMMRARYTSQPVVVFQEGIGGETAATGDGRFRSVLAADNAQVVLLLEGVNDLSEDPQSVSPMLAGLRSMVRHGKEAGVQVLLATLPPEGTGSNPRPRGRPAAIVTQANNGIRQIAASEGVGLVDLFQGLGGTADPYVGTDGLHLTDAGYHQVAQVFFDAIRARFETASALKLFQWP